MNAWENDGSSGDRMAEYERVFICKRKGYCSRTNYGGERNKIFLDVDGNSQYL
jgi:hypothetical protein